MFRGSLGKEICFHHLRVIWSPPAPSVFFPSPVLLILSHHSLRGCNSPRFPTFARRRVQLLCQKALVRDSARLCLTAIAAKNSLSLTQLLWPYRSIIQQHLFTGSLHSRIPSDQISLLHSLCQFATYCPPLVPLTAGTERRLKEAQLLTLNYPVDALTPHFLVGDQPSMLAAASAPTGAAQGLSQFLSSAPPWAISCGSSSHLPTSCPAPEIPEMYEPDLVRAGFSPLVVFLCVLLLRVACAHVAHCLACCTLLVHVACARCLCTLLVHVA